ncbi:uncharacterized protein LOC144160760 [Haemaphysalis longicornis]
MLARNPSNAFARGLLLTPGQLCKETKYGLAPASSPLAYQQALLPHGFSAQTSGILPVYVPYSKLVPPVDLFKDVQLWQPATHQRASLALERNTRQQSDSVTWAKERSLRLTSSNVGVVLARREWSLKGLQSLTASRDLSGVAPFRYNIANEAMAAKRYEEVLRTMGHDVTVLHCGLLGNPAFPWLGTSPDRLVFDPTEG